MRRAEKRFSQRKLSSKLDRYPFFNQGEPQFFVNILRKLPPHPVILEIGTFRGLSSALMAQQRKDAKITTIDSHIGMPGFDYLDSSEERVLKNLKKFGVSERVKHYPLSSQKFQYAGNRLDLLFIDGDHTYKGVDYDYHKFAPWVKKGGWIIFHDFGTFAGVTTFCNRITVNKDYLRFYTMLAIQK